MVNKLKPEQKPGLTAASFETPAKKKPELKIVKPEEMKSDLEAKAAHLKEELRKMVSRLEGTSVAAEAEKIMAQAGEAEQDLAKKLWDLQLLEVKKGPRRSVRVAKEKTATGIPDELIGEESKVEDPLDVVLKYKPEKKYQKKSEKSMTFNKGAKVNWTDPRGGQHVGTFDAINTTGLARVVDKKTGKPEYVAPPALKPDSDVEIAPPVLEDNPQISDKDMEESDTREMARKKIERVVDFDDLISVVKEIGSFPAEQGKAISGNTIAAILEEAKSGDSYTADSPIVNALPFVVRNKVKQLLEPRANEVKGLIADVRDWNELIQTVQDIGHFTKDNGTPVSVAEIVKALRGVTPEVLPNSPWVLAFPSNLQDKINELLAKRKKALVRVEPKPGPLEPKPVRPEPQPGEPEWEGPDIEPVDPNWKKQPGTPEPLPGERQLPPHRPEPGPGPGPRGPEPGPVSPEPQPDPKTPEQTPDQGSEPNPDLAVLRHKFAERDSELTDKYRGVFGWVRRQFDRKGYQDTLKTREDAYLAYDKERAQEIRKGVEKLLEEQTALADEKAKEFANKRWWGQKLYNWYGNSEFAKKMKLGRAAVGVGLIGAGLVFGAPAVAGALGVGYFAWKLMGAATSGVGTYDLLRMGEEKLKMRDIKLDKDNQTELDKFTAENKLGRFNLFRTAEQRQKYNDKLLELQGKQAGKLNDKDLDGMIQFYETTQIMKGRKISEDPLYNKLMQEKAKRLKEILSEVQAGEEGNEPERQKFNETVEARRKAKVDQKMMDVAGLLKLGESKGKASQGVRFEDMTEDAQNFVNEKFNWAEFQKLDSNAKEAALAKLKRQSQERFHPDKHPNAPEAADESIRSVASLIEKIKSGKATPVKESGERIELLQKKRFEELPEEVQTLLHKYEEKYGVTLATLHAAMFMPGTTGERPLLPALDAELRAALMNNEALRREAEEEVAAEMEQFITSVESKKESVEERKGRVLEFLASSTDSLNREMANKAKTRKDLMKLTAIAMSAIAASGVIQKLFVGNEASAKAAVAPAPGATPEVQKPFPVTNDISPRMEYGSMTETPDTFRPGEGVIRFAERHRDLFGGASNPEIERWSKALLLKKDLIEIDLKRGLVGYKFNPLIGGEGKIISVDGRPVDFEFGKGVKVADHVTRWIPLPQSDFAGMSEADIRGMMLGENVGLEPFMKGAEAAADQLSVGGAAQAAARMAERASVIEPPEIKYFWQTELMEPDALVPKEPLEYGF